MASVTAAQVVAEVKADGGDTTQQLVAAALVSGVESNGDPTELAEGIGPAAGLFQFEPGTWRSNGGSQYAPVAQDASWQQQVAVFVNATKGDNFGAWGPDLTGKPNTYGYKGPPLPGSPVYNKLQSLYGTQPFGGPGSTGLITPLIADALGPLGLATGATTADGVNPISDVNGLITEITSAHFWERVGLGVLGVGLFVTGLIVFFASTDTGKKAISDGEAAAPLLLA